ncbi:MAG: DNA alkylation repair protein [Candidatus Margulisiibacteriota bacterium]
MQYNDIISKLKSLSDPKAVEGMARFGINSENTFGVSVPDLRAIAKAAGKDHQLALELWESGIHEARILASMVDVFKEVTEEQAEAWVKEFDSWDVCDQCIMNLFRYLPSAYQKAIEWGRREEEFVRRAGFAMMASLAIGDKKADDKLFEAFFSLIVEKSDDERNFVKKAVNWALRQIGKRSFDLNKKAIQVAEKIDRFNSKSAKWIAKDALRELTDEKILSRIKR